MLFLNRKSTFAFILLLIFTGYLQGKTIPVAPTDNSILQVKITVQYPHFIQPWRLKNPEVRQSTGIYIGENRVLIPAQAIYFYTSIEIKKPDSLKVSTAELERLDPDLGLAILKLSEPNASKDLKAVTFPSEIFLPGTGLVMESKDQRSLEEKKIRMIRLDMDSYSSGYIELPYIEVQSEDKLDGVGELIVDATARIPQGILYQFKETGTGKVIPSFSIKHFIEGKSFPFKGFRFKPLIDSATRNYYGLRKDDLGVLIAEVYPGSSAEGILQLEDILLEVANFKIDPKGYFDHPKFGKLNLSYLFHNTNDNESFFGKKIKLKVFRNKKPISFELELKPLQESSIRIPYGNSRFQTPKYLMLAGIIFQELSEQYLTEHGNQWRNRVSKELLYLNDFYRIKRNNNEGKIVFLSQVLPLSGNKAYHSAHQIILKTMNGTPIQSLDQLQNLVKESNSPYIHFVMNDGFEMIFKKEEIQKLNAEAKQSFQIQKDSNF
ncbi:serine protease [Leptospira sp. 2 VSF19]|uniref:Serine protease n=1 Tax=Leptospira soteropolitanensis TaxID=2950025 RepID=A0AAW5VGN6_9LEPT|nr:serine protease [Leptospira soteropolitanensis]MCW7492451.1 serine protease [Leptospira soteropolitanensis]MCW7500502.1 serine protease [Leptospira soteropolitanensis]MCW7522828.1 serine protease [Leptospira soteropolitanensis]MCW7526687.1 serine protease [Leptospira soteropolitanensis]MCW7530472.1 serine protease [Leptospira soteropolitanensis]